MEKKAEIQDSLQALQASETRYRRLFETAQDGILILNAETGEIDDVNPYMIGMLHYSYEEFIGMKLWEVSPFKDTVLNKDSFEELQNKGYIRYKDLPLETKEGEPIAVEFVSNVYKANGNKVVQCNILNITERTEAKRKLQESVIFQQRLIDALPIPVFYKDSEGRYLGCNNSFEKFFGQKREQVIGKSVHELSPKEFADIYDEKDQALLQNPRVQTYESTVKDTGGVVHNVVFHKATFPNMDGSVGGLIGGILDITERKLAEERYRSIFENAQEGIVRSTPEGKIIMANQAIAKMFGYKSPEEAITSITDVIEQHYVNPEERGKLKGMIEGHGFIKGYETQCRRKDGIIIWVSMTMHPGLNEKGQIVYYDGIIEDITERKRAEEALRESLDRSQAILASLDDAVFLVDPATRLIIECNHAAARIFGYSHEEMVGRETNFLHIDQTHFEQFGRHLMAAFEDPGYYTTEFEMRRKDGGVFPTDHFVRPVHEPDGRISYVVSVVRDITHRKQAEEEQKQTMENLRKSLIGTIQALSSTVETRDPYTAGHQRMVSKLARAIAQEMGLPSDTVDTIRMAGIIHDIGKISVPAEILSKTGKISDIEMSLIKVHPQSGYDILKDVGLPYPIAGIVLQHHERLDGSGYPQGLKGDQILLEAQIVSVADVVEAISSIRPYRPALGIDAALQEIEKNKGILYNEKAVEVCIKLFRDKAFKFD
jgi:PAS domain S-box-containing protein/putative nucleotidyltransferase with HDIG domain